ncbi:hypothetical protein O1K_10067 [Xanthomonas fragariae LMG 25863]|nr:hypothetical protein BER92_17815 [Xanthomonas fragariae]ENZ95440.1 hypothetical protein O1K_10067 [Xanthomonas fragariae LMG 25863]
MVCGVRPGGAANRQQRTGIGGDVEHALITRVLLRIIVVAETGQFVLLAWPAPGCVGSTAHGSA